MDLSPQQERAVNTDGHCTVLACPGSGKTRVLAARAVRILNSHAKGRLCAVTFTRDAAKELKSRILASCGPEHSRRLVVGTFHSLALAQIKRFGQGKPPRLLSDGERMAVLRRCWKQHASGASFDDVVQAIDAIKSKVTRAPCADRALEVVFQAYQDVMESEGAMDFSDLLVLTVRHMTDGTMRTLPIQWLLVDEAQDMDEVQMEWIMLHGRAGVEVTLVGDDDQSLYGFRQALGYDGIQQVTVALSSTEVTLPVNYRCANDILGHAIRLIAHNRVRAPKQITAHRQDAGSVRIMRAPDREGEAAQIVGALLADQRPGGWAVLARTNAILDSAELALSNSGTPFLRSGGKSVWEHSVGSVFLGLMRSVVDDSWTGLANALSFGGIHAEWVNSHSRSSFGGCVQRLDLALQKLSASDGEHRTMLRLRMGFEAWRDQASKGRPVLSIHGVAAFLAEYCKPNQLSLLRSLEASVARKQGSLAQRLSFLGRNAHDRQDAVVHIMTLHASKGLEFDCVWIMGCEDGNLPHTDSTEEEERRLLYVGMTRARHRLILSSSMEDGLESRFLEEAGLA